MHKPHPQGGFTLIELLLYLALTTSMVALLGGFGVTVLESNAKTHALDEVGYNGVFLMSAIERYLSEADGVTSPGDKGTSSILTLTMADPAHDPTTIYISEGSVYVQRASDTPHRLTTPGVSVSKFQFRDGSYDNGTTLHVEATIKAIHPEGRKAYEATETFQTSFFRYAI